MKRNFFNTKWLLSAVLLAGTTLVSKAQNVRSITAKEAVQLSLQNNKQLKIAKARIDEATANVQEAEDRRLPEASATAMYILLKTPGVDLKIKTGSDSSGSKPSSSHSFSSVAVTMVNASLPIYAGGQIKYGIESARYLAEARNLDAEYDKSGVVQNTLNACRNLFKASQTVSLVQENLKQEQERVKQFTNLEKNGLLARNDLLKASLQTSNVELALLEAQNNLNIANVNMDLMLGLPETTKLEIDTTGFKVTFDNKGLAEWEQLAFDNRKDIASLQQQKKATDANLKAINGERMPTVALTGGYISAYLQNIATITNAINLGVTAKYSISTLWKNKAKMTKAKAQQDQLVYTQEMLDENIRMEITKAYEDYFLLQKKIEVYGRAIEQADENYKITKNKYNNGLATLTELLDADLAELRAKLNQSLARADVALAYVQLQKSAGVLTQNF
ncbi:MAG: TolC family protein [Chitinophagaceae bacterium]